ncbi:MAG: hypothetical protein N2C14_09095, partial [Planctomycetales bacterium]
MTAESLDQDAEHLGRLQALLRELFQLDAADLDFGAYRLLRLRREEIQSFLSEGLPRAADEAFANETDADEAFVNDDEHAAQSGEVSRDSDPNSDSRRRRREETDALKSETFHHLHAFFSRYYQDGDFLPRRRHGSREQYAVPYHGEEIFLHWANRDQHYVKTTDRFKEYAFRVARSGREYRVRFLLADAEEPKDNVKGPPRFLFVRARSIDWDPESGTLTIPWEHRAARAKETSDLQGKAAARLDQAAVSAQATKKILSNRANPELRAALAEDQRTEAEIARGKPELPLLLKHIRRFARRNSGDYFIHKRLREFLSQELEFYLKDQVLRLGDLDGEFQAKRRMIRAARAVGERIIDFLSQVEDVQRRLFEKKKFVLESRYCMTLDRVPEDLYPEIAANEPQCDEWRRMFELGDFRADAQFLREHPKLPLDTIHFDDDFRARLLATFDNLEDAVDGILIRAENYQALRFLSPRFLGRVRCVYIDPPFNLGERAD